MHAVSTNRIEDILHFNGNNLYNRRIDKNTIQIYNKPKIEVMKMQV